MELYEFSGNMLSIIDPEIGISIKESYHPICLPEKCVQGEELAEAHKVQMYNFQDGSKEVRVEKDGVFDGEFCTYYSNGGLKHRCFYLNGLLHANSIYYDKDGTVLTDGWFYQGKQVGKLKWYYKSKKRYSVQRFLEGAYHGIQEYWYENGNVKTLMEYSRGTLHGKVELYHPNGSLFRTLQFKKGVNLHFSHDTG